MWSTSVKYMYQLQPSPLTVCFTQNWRMSVARFEFVYIRKVQRFEVKWQIHTNLPHEYQTVYTKLLVIYALQNGQTHCIYNRSKHYKIHRHLLVTKQETPRMIMGQTIEWEMYVVPSISRKPWTDMRNVRIGAKLPAWARTAVENTTHA